MNSKKLKGKRAELGHTQKSLGELICKHESAYSRKENGQNEFTLAEVLTLTLEAQLSLEEFNDIFFDGKLPFGNKTT